MPSNAPRLMMDFAGTPFAGQLFLGWYQFPHARERLERHVHAGAMEICYLATGMQTYEVGGRPYVLHGNEVFVTFPDEEHSTGIAPQEKGTLYWMQARFPAAEEPYLVFAPQQTQPLFAQLGALPQRLFPGNLRLKGFFEQAIACAQRPESALQRLELATSVMSILLETLHAAHTPGDARPDASLNRCLDYLDAHLTENPSVSELAALMGLSVSHFKAKFKQHIGIPPAEYLLRRKIARAQQLLDIPTCSITDIAYQLGFSSSQYFATVFRRYTNSTPRAYRDRRNIRGLHIGI